MFFLKLFLFLNGLYYTHSLKIAVANPSQDVLLQECTHQIVDMYFNQSDTILYLNLDPRYQNVDFNLLPAIKINKLSAMKNFEHIKPDWYIITVDKVQIQDVMFYLRDTGNWNPKAKMVIVYSGWIRTLTNILKALYVLNVVILSETWNTIDIATYFPHNTTIFGKDIVGKCKAGKLVRLYDFYPRKPYCNENKIHAIVSEGRHFSYQKRWRNYDVEEQLFDMVMKRIGCQPLKIVDFYQLIDTETYYYTTNTESLMGVDMYLGLKGEIASRHERSIPFLYDSLEWAVPVVKLEISRYRLVNIFDYSLWFGLMVVICIVPFAFYYMAVLASDVANYRRFSDCIIMTVQCLIGHPVNVMPRTNPVRLALTVTLMFNCVIITAYQSRLLWDFYESTKQISTVKELLDSNVKVAFSLEFDMYFANDVKKNGKEILNVREKCAVCAYFRRIRNREEISIFSSKHTIMNTLQMNLGRNKESPIYFLKDKVIPLPVTFVFMKGFPLAEEINKALEELRENGITQHFTDLADYLAEEPIKRALEMQYAPHPMDLKKLQGAFWLLFLGLLISTVLFVCEVVFSRCISRRLHCSSINYHRSMNFKK